MTRYKYCDVCKKEVEHPVRKPLETFQKIIWVIVSIATIGIGAIVFLFYNANRKKKYCPTCFAEVRVTSEPVVEEEVDTTPLTPKEKILKKAGVEKETAPTSQPEKIKEPKKAKDATFCPYCGEDIDEGIEKCPYCHSKLKAPYESR